MTRTSTTRALLAAALCTMAFAAGAQDATPNADASPAEKRAQAEEEALHDRNCLRETGSRIATRIKPRADSRDAKRCVSATGRSYSGEELRRTGRWDLADALRSLDPAVH
jgi:hypothetical protein